MTDQDSIHDVFARTPANRHLGSRLVEIGDGTATLAMTAREELIQEVGVVHGGYLTTLADTAGVYALVPHVADPMAMTGVEFKMNFVRPATPTGGEVEARATTVKRGRTLAVVDVEVFQDDRLLAKGLFTYLVGR